VSLNYDNIQEQFKKLIAQRLPDKEREALGFSILQLTACMSPRYRKAYGSLYAFIQMSNDKTLEPLLPMLQIMGRVEWIRGPLEDMGALVGETEFDFINLDESGITKS
jgi:hypothetical protein